MGSGITCPECLKRELEVTVSPDYFRCPKCKIIKNPKPPKTGKG
jgi:ssDNA-binding Zn-finger/Zn-ribbon topoisomerase 1